MGVFNQDVWRDRSNPAAAHRKTEPTVLEQPAEGGAEVTVPLVEMRGVEKLYRNWTRLHMARKAVAVLLVVHGLIHLLGFVVPWRLASIAGFPDRTDVLGGADVGTTGARILGVFWLVACLGFVASGLALLLGRAHWWEGAVVSAVLSLILAVLWVQQAYFGAVIDVVVIAAILGSKTVRGTLAGPTPRLHHAHREVK